MAVIETLLVVLTLVGLATFWRPRGKVLRTACALVQVVVLGISLMLSRSVEGDLDHRFLLAVLIVGAGVFGGNVVVLEVLARAFPESTLRSVGLPASSWIGHLERFTFLVALVMGLVEVAALVVGVKALGVYGLGGHEVAAMRVAGTLASISWALLCFGVFASVYPLH